MAPNGRHSIELVAPNFSAERGGVCRFDGRMEGIAAIGGGGVEVYNSHRDPQRSFVRRAALEPQLLQTLTPARTTASRVPRVPDLPLRFGYRDFSTFYDDTRNTFTIFLIKSGI